MNSVELSVLRSPIERLRQRLLLRAGLVALADTVFLVAVGAVVLRLVYPQLVLRTRERLALAVATMVCLIAAFVVESMRRNRSVGFLAKVIDDLNGLSDHLTSSLSFSLDTQDPFEQACVRTTVRHLQEHPMALPRVPLTGMWILVPAVVLGGVVGAVELRRRTHPSDDGRALIQLGPEVARRNAELEKLAAAKGIDPALAEQVTSARSLLSRVAAQGAIKERVLEEAGELQSQVDRLALEQLGLLDAAVQLGEPSTQRASQLVAALRSGNEAALSKALSVIADALAGRVPPPLNDMERAEIAGVLDALARAGGKPELAAQLGQAAEEVRGARSAGKAGGALEEVAAQLPAQMTRELATQRLTHALRGALAELGRTRAVQKDPSQAGGKAGGGAGAQPGEDEDETNAAAPGGVGGGQAAAGGGTTETFGGGEAEAALTGRDVRVPGTWSGASVSRLVRASASDEEARKAMRVMLSAERRALESGVKREEIPPEHAQAVRRYFISLQRGAEQSWKPNK